MVIREEVCGISSSSSSLLAGAIGLCGGRGEDMVIREEVCGTSSGSSFFVDFGSVEYTGLGATKLVFALSFDLVSSSSSASAASASYFS